MKAYLTPRDLQRLPMETRVAIDMMLEHGAEISVVSKRKCREALKAAPLKNYRIVGVGTPCDNRTDRVRRSNDKPSWRRLDDWDLVQAFAPVHQPVTLRTLSDLASLSGILKAIYSADRIEAIYSADRIEALAYDTNPFMPNLDR